MANNLTNRTTINIAKSPAPLNQEWVEDQLRKALKYYSDNIPGHVEYKDIIADPSDDFFESMVEDYIENKSALWNKLSMHPKFDPVLGAVVIDCTSTEPPNFHDIYAIVEDILMKSNSKLVNPQLTAMVAEFIAMLGANNFVTNPMIEKFEEAFPKAYVCGKKPSRIFMAVCQQLGIADTNAGSSFQHDYAYLADELSAKKGNYKLIISLNPGHIITGSNPHNDIRGKIMKSCHSLDSELSYSVGNISYAIDPSCMIVFTVKDINDEEALFSRKTSRQFFFYNGSDVLMQSRLYIAKSNGDSYGGTEGEQPISKEYREIVERVICEAENIPNLWKKPMEAVDNLDYLDVHHDFGGYRDWEFEKFKAKIVLHKNSNGYEPIQIGNHGRCISCGSDTDEYIQCSYCSSGEICDDCGERISSDESWSVIGRDGGDRNVCTDCRDNNYSWCECCEHYVYESHTRYLDYYDCYVCDDCIDQFYEECDCCGDYFRPEDMVSVIHNGEEVAVCPSCWENECGSCDDCGENIHNDDSHRAYSSRGYEVDVCIDCLEDSYRQCPHCGAYINVSYLDEGEEGTCPDCGVTIYGTDDGFTADAPAENTESEVA